MNARIEQIQRENGDFYSYKITEVSGGTRRVLHSVDDEPAVQTELASKWYCDGKKHRDVGPAVVTYTISMGLKLRECAEYWKHGKKVSNEEVEEHANTPGMLPRISRIDYGSNAKVVRVSSKVTLYTREHTKCPLIEVGMGASGGDSISGFRPGDFYCYTNGEVEIVSTSQLGEETRRFTTPSTGVELICRSVVKCQGADGKTHVIVNYPTSSKCTGRVLYEDAECLVLIV